MANLTAATNPALVLTMEAMERTTPAPVSYTHLRAIFPGLLTLPLMQSGILKTSLKTASMQSSPLSAALYQDFLMQLAEPFQL